MAITSFTGEFAFLSNFYRKEFRYKGHSYKTAEHAFQAEKCVRSTEAVKVRLATTPREAKRIGNSVQLRPNWDEIRVPIMAEIVHAKFYSDAELAKKLLDTDGQYLEEGNSWGDTFWGVCKGKGSNHLGWILMQVRDELNEGRAL